ncbi:MAG: hypothetical protein ABR520_10740 [Mycobacteriales bacterium]|nr:hypothetical protein [Frankia sp.]
MSVMLVLASRVVHLAHGSGGLRIHTLHAFVYTPMIGYLTWRMAREWRSQHRAHERTTARESGATLVPAVAIASAASASLHALVAPEHFGESWLYGAFFVAVTLFQLRWAVAILRQPQRTLLWVGAVANAAIAAVWLYTRTRGIPFGPETGRVEGVGIVDVLATTYELAVVALALALLRRDADALTRADVWSRWSRPARATLLGVLVLTATGAALAGHG